MTADTQSVGIARESLTYISVVAIRSEKRVTMIKNLQSLCLGIVRKITVVPVVIQDKHIKRYDPPAQSRLFIDNGLYIGGRQRLSG